MKFSRNIVNGPKSNNWVLVGIWVINCIQEPSHHFLQTFRPLRMFKIVFRNSSLGFLYITTKRKFSCALYSHSQFLCSLARFDLANRDVQQPDQPHAFCSRLLVFDETLVQPDFAVANRSDAATSKALWRSIDECVSLPSLNAPPDIFAVMNLLCISVEFIFLRYPNLKRW